jgi:hypothetical protein
MAIWFCAMEFNCPKQWDELTVTADPMVRQCAECGKSVHYVDSQGELEDAAAEGKCVAFYNQEKDDLPPEKRRDLQRTWRIKSLGGRLTLGLPRKPMSDKLKAFIDKL